MPLTYLITFWNRYHLWLFYAKVKGYWLRWNITQNLYIPVSTPLSIVSVFDVLYFTKLRGVKSCVQQKEETFVCTWIDLFSTSSSNKIALKTNLFTKGGPFNGYTHYLVDQNIEGFSNFFLHMHAWQIVETYKAWNVEPKIKSSARNRNI